MNYDAILNKINQYFESAEADSLIKSFEMVGFEFEEIKTNSIERGNLHRYSAETESTWVYQPKENYRAAKNCSFFLYLN